MNTTDDTVTSNADKLTKSAPVDVAAESLENPDNSDIDRFESFRSHITAQHQQAPSEGSRRPQFVVESKLTVSDSWMRSSFENAQRTLPIQDFPMKGFRPGKAPKHLIEKQHRERALELARAWVVEDLRRFLGELLDVLVIGSIGAPVTVEWAGPGSSLTTIFRFEGWLYPHIDVDSLCRHLYGIDPHYSALNERVYEYLSSKFIPPGLENALMLADDLSAALPQDEATAQKHLRQALVNNLLAQALDVFVTDEDLDKGYGEYAIERSLSLLEAKEELEPMYGVFIQKIETEKAYAALRERLKQL